MALNLLGVALWVVFGGAGAWLLLTGRNTVFGLPMGFDDALLRRLFGLVWVLVAAFFLYSFSRGSFSPWPVFWLYAGFGFATLFEWWKTRGARA
jgi:hypothetical protein